MATPNPAPIAAPRRGKFLSAPTSSPEKPAATPSSVQGAASLASNAGDAEKNDSLDNLRAHIHNSKIAAVSRRKAIADQRDRVFRDLDDAENIVLSLLECASDVAGALSEMTTAKSKKSHGEQGDDGEGNAEDSFEDLSAKVRSNGVGYLAGVKSLHKLLAPHASLVKSYKNHDGEESTDSETPHRSLTTVKPSATGATNSSKIVEEATSNMYAARVKKRLAMERSAILTEMIRLEELEGGSNDGGEESEETYANTVGSKRKHESIKQEG